ncbi:MAG: hypothetical protein PF482_12590 [Desulfobacteraceae bacterium]|nr:hypothetical protein [Desulfobacteraceae bacterium]
MELIRSVPGRRTEWKHNKIILFELMYGIAKKKMFYKLIILNHKPGFKNYVSDFKKKGKKSLCFVAETLLPLLIQVIKRLMAL